MPTRSRASASRSTGCRWRSSSRPRGSSCCPRRRSSSGWREGWTCWRQRPEIARHASRPCAGRSSGAIELLEEGGEGVGTAAACGLRGWRRCSQAAEAVCGWDGVDVLEAVGIARRQEPAQAARAGGRPGGALPEVLEVVREYALEQLEASGEAAEARGWRTRATSTGLAKRGRAEDEGGRRRTARVVLAARARARQPSRRSALDAGSRTREPRKRSFASQPRSGCSGGCADT